MKGNTILSGKIIILNGAPRSGKTTLAKTIQTTFAGVWLNLGVDHMMACTPASALPGIGLRPGGEHPELEPLIQRMYQGLFASIAGYARLGLNVVADLDIHDDYATPQHVWPLMLQTFADLPLLLVGVTAPMAVIQQRRLATWGQSDSAMITQRWAQAVHLGHQYDLMVDTDQLTPMANAERIRMAMDARVL